MRIPSLKLSLHATGQYAKQIGGKMYYFGTCEVEALRRLAALVEAMQADSNVDPATFLKQRVKTSIPAVNAVPSIQAVCEHFRHAKLRQVQSGMLSPLTFRCYGEVIDAILSVSRTTPVDQMQPIQQALQQAAIGNSVSPGIQRRKLTILKSIWRYAFEAELVGRPIRFPVRMPSRKDGRIWKATKGKTLFSPESIRTMLDNAKPVLKAAIYLGVNAAYHSIDVARVRWDMIDGQWLSSVREKTGIPRRVFLWDETLQALRAASRSSEGLILRTRTGSPLIVQHQDSGCRTNSLCRQFRANRDRCGIAHGTFRWLRTTHRTISDSAGDTSASRTIMGHEIGTGMDAVYVAEVSDERLEAVSQHVWQWLHTGRE